jgi:hypothetical protein
MVIQTGRAENVVAPSGLDYSLWDSLLAEAVHNVTVDYSVFQKRFSDLETYLTSLSGVDRKALSNPDRIVFEINAYHAGLVRGIISAGKIGSVNEIPSFFNKTVVVLGGETLSLEQLLNESLRTLGEPLVHFAIYTSAISGPCLLNKAYRGETLEQDLEQQLKAFLEDPAKNHLDKEQGVYHLSKIFKWFEKDFTAQSLSILDYLIPHLTKEDQDYLNSHPVKVEFMPFDWTLNGSF